MKSIVINSYKKLFTFGYLVFLSLSFIPASTNAQDSVLVFKLDQDIMPFAVRLVKNALDQANEEHCKYVIMELNTYGGELDAGDSIRKMFLDAKPVIIDWITQNAASAGALISIACDSIYMRPASTLGAASVVDESGQIMPEKYQSYMRGMMRSTAEHQGRDPKIAEGMVTPNNYLPDVADSNKIITLTASEALKHGYCNGIADNLNEVLKAAHLQNAAIITYQQTFTDDIFSFLINPIVNGILLLLIISGIFWEFNHPGLGLPIIAAIIAAALYFAPLYLDGLAEHWEILLFIAGVILLALEILIIPGFGVTGVLGIVFMIGGLTLALVNNNNFDFSFTGAHALLIALLRVILPFAVALVLFISFGGRFFRSGLMKGFVLTHTQGNSTSFYSTSRSLDKFLGKTGNATSVLRPSGQVEIDGSRYDAMARDGFIEAGSKVEVVQISGAILVVKRTNSA